ncbi:hypothetical protein [Promicromonospora panici]|uniref:hypothetical protein n=1 Tax=Promicromonospora panici TaxID=2219658 RepID=UPI0013EC9667|nr:hypothetical protein [Promicromonospora panici]
MSARREVQLLGAVAVALLLLTGTGTTYAGWTDTTEVGRGHTVTSGDLRIEPVRGEASVRRGGATLPTSTPLLPGDVVEITTSVRLAVSGVAGRLALDATRTADAFADAGVALGTPNLTVAGLAPGPAAVDGTTWQGQVTGADDGALVTGTVQLPVRTDLAPAAQGRSVDLTATPVTWDLAQESTVAGWHDGERATLEPVTVDRVGLTVARTGAGAWKVTNTSGSASVTWGPTAVSAAPLGATTSTEATNVLSGLTIGYGTDCSTQRWQAQPGGATRPVTGTGDTLAAGASSGLCAQVAPTDASSLVRDYGARSVELTTTVTTTAAAAPTWTATGTAQATYQVAFPQPTGLTCQSGLYAVLLETPAKLTWSWADSTTKQPAVALWELVRQASDGSWRTVDKSITSSLSVDVHRSDLPSDGTTRKFKVRAYPFSTSGTVDRSVYVESDTVASLRRDVLDAPVCDGSPQPNNGPAAAPISGGLS